MDARGIAQLYAKGISQACGAARLTNRLEESAA
jgi:hypothetical protein